LGLSASFLFLVVLVFCAGEAPGTISTAAGTGTASLGPSQGPAKEFAIDQPFGVEVGPDGALYICEVGHHRVLRLDPSGRRVTTVAGTGEKGYSGDGGPATRAQLNEPYEVRFDAAGDFFFVEMVGAVVRKVSAKDHTIVTVAGTGRAGFGGDGGPATKADLRQPHSIALDGAGGLFIADIGNHRIRRVNLKRGTIETIAGNGEAELPRDGEKATGQPLRGPRALFIAKGILWIALREGHSVWRMDLATGVLQRVAGTGEIGFRDGPAAQATFNGPKGIAAGPDGSIFVVDTENHAIRRIDGGLRTVSTVAGGGPAARGFGGDGGPALQAKMDRPHGIAVDSEGTIYIGDSNNHRVRRVAPRR